MKFLITVLITASYFIGYSQVNIDNSDYYFFEKGALAGLIKYDTLVLTAEFTECGEWGGRKEVIKIYRNLDYNLTAELLVDSVSCTDGQGNVMVTRYKKIAQTVVIQKEAQEEIIECIGQMSRLIFVDQDILSNACNNYFVYLTRLGEHKFELDYNDFPSEWRGFEKLRDSIF